MSKCLFQFYFGVLFQVKVLGNWKINLFKQEVD